MYLTNKCLFLGWVVALLCGCSTGFLGLAPLGDRKEYAAARDLYSQGLYQQAIVELNAYISKTKNVKRREARAYRLLGESYEQLGQYNKALDTYLEALEFHPKNVALLVAAANLYQKTELLDQAQSLYEKALHEEPTHLEALSGLAHNYHLIGFNAKARTIYEQFFKQNPQAEPLYRARYAQTFLAQRDYQQAFILLSQLVSEYPDNPDFWLLSAQAAYGLKNWNEALENINTALWLAPNRRDLLATKALWLYQNNQGEESLKTATKILEQDPSNQLALFIQAINWEQKNQKTKAKKQLERVVQLDKNTFVGKVAAQILEFL